MAESEERLKVKVNPRSNVYVDLAGGETVRETQVARGRSGRSAAQTSDRVITDIVYM